MPANWKIGFALTVCAAALGADRPEPATWFAGDPHTHRGILCARSNADRMLTPDEVREMMRPNDLDVVAVLGDIGNGEIRESAIDLPLVGKSDGLMHWDAEWHFDPQGVTFDQKAIGGHLIVLGLQHAEVIYHEYTYPVIDWARKQGAVVGFAHMQYLPDGFPEKMSCCDPVEYPVEVALGSGVFLMEDVRGSETALPHYYHLLNCGFRPGLAAGTDYPCDSPPLPLGNLLTYVYVPDGKLTYRKWIDGIAGGRTVISRHGHEEFLDLKVNGETGPGGEVALAKPDNVRVQVTWTAKQPESGRVELVRDGKVVSIREAKAKPGAPHRASESLEFRESGWVCARRMDAKGHVLHTAAVFVKVGGAPLRPRAEDAEFYVHFLERLLEKTGPGGEWSGYFHNEGDAARARYQAALDVFQKLAKEGGAQ
jgi:hypothetical protein